MPSIFPDGVFGGVVTRDNAGLPTEPDNVPNIYVPDDAFAFSHGNPTGYDTSTGYHSRWSPARDNAVTSELLALAEAMDPAGTWDMQSLVNLKTAWQNFLDDLPGGGDMLGSNNLSDLDSAATARANLDLEIGVDVQAYNANLDGWAAIAPSSKQAALGYTPLNAASNLSDIGNAGTARTNLGVAIGSQVQAYAANLTSWALIAPSAKQDALGFTPVNRAGDTMTGLLTLSGAPSSSLHAATKAYVDAVASGLQPKTEAVLATTANVTLSGEQTIDGTLTSATRILVKNQTAPAENGLYVTGAGAWTRATDLDAWAEVPQAFVFITSGTLQSKTGWVTSAVAGGTLNTTAIPWVQFSAAGTYAAASGGGLTLIGSEFSVDNDNLEALMPLTGAANKLPYYTSSTAMATTDFVANGRTLVGHTFAQMKADLDLEIGVDVQAWSTNLDAWSAIATSSKQAALGYTPLNAASNLSDVASASTARSNLGLAIGTNVQAYAANLTSWAGLAPSAKQDALGYTPLNVASNLSDLASATTARTNLGVAIGTHVQAYSSNLDSWAGLAPSAKQNALGYTPVNKAGDTMGGILTLSGAPSGGNDAATKTYVDTAVAGVTGPVKAWGKFAGSSGTVAKSSGITSVTRNSTGTYTVVMSSAMADTNYGLVFGSRYANQPTIAEDPSFTRTTTQFRFLTNEVGIGVADLDHVYFAVLD